MPISTYLTDEEEEYALANHYARLCDDTRTLKYLVQSADKGFAPALHDILNNFLFTAHEYNDQTLYDTFSRPNAGPVSLACMGMFYEDERIVPKCEYVARDYYRKSMDAGCIIGKIMYTGLMYKQSHYNIVLRHLNEIFEFPEYIQLNSTTKKNLNNLYKAAATEKKTLENFCRKI
jgi:TPR repeat protein